ncbi:MAG: TIGR01457 family HAD-type hydrolase, partial [Acidimicrobiia bacterium]|nr:TIGR01457 family HAD-type hydrolase [Acidimicrobiia bacterium]
MVDPGDRVLAIGSDGVFEALRARGCTVVHDGPADAVIMGITQAFDYEMMTRAMHAIADGARFIATNTDSTFPMADRLVPGNGALVA